MADDLREVLSKYVPAGVLDAVADEVRTAATPDSFRKELGELGAKAKKADELEAELESIKSAPKRKEALKRVGIDYDAVPQYGKEALDGIPAADLDNLEKVASYVQSKGFEANFTPEQQAQNQSGAEQITNALTSIGAGTPVTTGRAAAEQAFYADLDKVRDGDKAGMTEVLAKHGRLPATEG